MSRTNTTLSYLVALALLTVSSHAQTTLHGRVLDPLGAAVPNASITSASPAAQTTSAADGSYALPLTCPCTLHIAASSFSDTTLTVSAQLVDLTLRTPTRTDEVSVTTGTPTPLAQSGAPISILTSASDFPHTLQLEQALRLIPGVQLTSSGQAGAQTSIFLRGGNSDFTKVLIDGVPVNDVGTLADLSTLASAGIAQVEVLRQPSSVLYGSDVLSGVVSLSSARGTTLLPWVTYAADGGNLGTAHQEATLSGARSRADFLTGVGVLQTANDQPNDQFHSTSFFGNYGLAPDPRDDLRLTFRHIHTNSGNPNAIALFGVPDNINQFYAETFLSLTGQQQTTPRWHNLGRYGWEALNYTRTQFALAGTPNNSLFATLGNNVTITGANGYSVSGQAQLDYFGTYPATALSTTRRDFAYGQSDFRASHFLTALAGFQFESERGASQYSSASRRNSSGTLQLSGDALSNRLFYVVGSGIENNDLYGRALTPRASLALYAIRPDAARLFSGTKLHASFGKGIQEPSIGDQVFSLSGSLGGQYSRTYDAGLEQQFGDSRARLNLSWFHNQFTNVVEYVPFAGLKQLGIANPAPFGAYFNSLAYRAEGAELESEVRFTRSLFLRAGYTYLDARVQRSFSSDGLGASFNTSSSFASTPIGNFSPLVGARPFRRAPHTGYFALQYTHSRLNTQLTGTLVGRRDDSTFLGGSDASYGNSLLLPNRNLDGAYQRLALFADFRVSARLTTYANLDNLLDQSYQEAFGYPALPLTIRGGFRLSFGGESFHLR